MIAIELKDGKFQAEFQALIGRAKRPRAVLAGVGREAQQGLKRHFRAKDRNEPNRLGGKRTHVFLEVSDSVQAPVIESGDTVARVSINHPIIAQKVFGGRIVAKNTKFLTIPITAEAHGRTAETFEHETGQKLFLLAAKGGTFAGLASQYSHGAIVVQYILKKSVNQKPDPSALPDLKDGSPFVKALLRRGEAIVARQLAAPGTAQ